MRIRSYILYVLLSLLILGCKQGPNYQDATASKGNHNFDYSILFVSCNDQDRPQPLWGPILEQQADLFIWGGDNIYADTEDMVKMKLDYDKVWARPEYVKLANHTAVTGTWDDHDFGIDDGGKEYPKIEESKKLFLDFLRVSKDDPRWSREGIYTSEIYETPKGSIKLILLDTRTFRDSLKKSQDPDRRYDPWRSGDEGTILGEEQWIWLQEELKGDAQDFTLIVSSIQFLNDRHGWESWGLFPSEVKRFEQLLSAATTTPIIILSGDRHLAEISKAKMEGLDYPLIDFTASGMTHTWIDGATEANEHRISNVVKRLNFGLLQFDFENKQVLFQIRGENNFLYEQHLQQY
ncbi:MAG: alkaline phosphatase family protein [Flavobacteriaceae bacterium]|nr:alkaline phosphatase family protein [Flavobacteriaceae bacterium]